MIYFKHSLIVDIKIFFHTLWKSFWLINNGYYFYLLQPKCFERRNKREWKKIASWIEAALLAHEKSLKIDKDYTIYLTPFGTFGSYKLPNKIYLNIFRKPNEMAKTLIHEIVHIIAEPKVKKLKLNHDQKEELIDKLTSDII